MTSLKDVVEDAPVYSGNYGHYLKPKIYKFLKASGLDKSFIRAEGDSLFYVNDGGEEQEVVDFLGGYGVSLFGHNHPELVDAAMTVLKEKKAFSSQVSVRSEAGNLAKKLADMFKARTEHDYITTLTNSGAEAVEAALKHATLEKQLLKQGVFETQQQSFKALRLRLRSNFDVPDDLFSQAEKSLNVANIDSIDELEYALTRYNETVLESPASFVALQGAFHGKSSGALQLTFNQEFRGPWAHLGIETTFVERNNIESLEGAFKSTELHYYSLTISPKGEVQLVKNIWSPIVACFAEAIQGEGGIHELSYDFAQALRQITQSYTIPLVMDEIQSGMGRTGSFLASESLDIVADYYLLSKALGGGLAKVAALLVKQERYIEDFGYLHTSTFAEDDFSSAIALKGLELLESQNGSLMQSCFDKGKYIKAKLEKLVQSYPDIFVEVRGRGLLLGLELTPQHTSKSNFMQMLSQQNLLTYLICGYIFNVHHIRITPTLSANTTIRIEPSAYIELAAIDKLCLALEDVAKCIQDNDCHALVHFLFKEASPSTSFRTKETLDVEVSVATDIATNMATDVAQKQIKTKVACVGHFMKPEDLLHWDPYLVPMTDAECNVLLEKTQDVLGPFLTGEQTVSSINGETVKLYTVGVPYTADQLMHLIRNGQASTALNIITQAHQLAVKTGSSQIGFTGYSSIATNNCRAIVEDNIGATSGNSLTVALSLEALHKVIDELHIDVETACLGIVGGAGNIGRIMAEIESEQIPKLLLIGREGSQKRLKRLAYAIYLKAWQRIKATELFDEHNLQGVAKTVFNSGVIDSMPDSIDEAAIGEFIFKSIRTNDAPIRISTSMQDLSTCNLIITATNTADTIIFPEHLSNQKTIICDVSVPIDVDSTVAVERPHTRVIQGGLVQLPAQQHLDLAGMPLEAGQLYACIAETVLLGLSGISENFSYGPLEQVKVQRIRRLSRDHGFEVLVKEA